MVNTAHRLSLFLTRTVWLVGGSVLGFHSTLALAQSAGSFATAPYVPATTPIPAPAPAVVRPATPPLATYKGPPPVVMFRATSPVAQPVRPTDSEPVTPQVQFVPSPSRAAELAPPPAPRPYSIVNQAQIDAQNSGWDPMKTDPVVAPPVVADDPVTPMFRAHYATGTGSARPPQRRALRRILQDSGRALAYDVPEALADALPWVDRHHKNEPFDEVLDRVADELRRASEVDPAWALPAQREIRDLAKRLDFMPAPPPLGQQVNARPEAIGTGIDDRPFRPRPIWPGASGRPEAQLRPVTLVTETGQQAGPRATGVATRYVPAAEDDDGNPPAATPRRRPGSGQPTPSRRAPKAR
jgi:hypothetical protein